MIDKVIDSLILNDIRIATGVPDGYLVPLIEAMAGDERIDYIAAAREEECLGIASGAAMAGKRAIVVIQNSGFLNALGCFSTLCQPYQTPFVCLIAHRGNLHDSNSYDPGKYRSYEAVIRALNLFHVRSDWAELPDIIGKAIRRAEGERQPQFINLVAPPGEQEVC